MCCWESATGNPWLASEVHVVSRLGCAFCLKLNVEIEEYPRSKLIGRCTFPKKQWTDRESRFKKSRPVYPLHTWQHYPHWTQSLNFVVKECWNISRHSKLSWLGTMCLSKATYKSCVIHFPAAQCDEPLRTRFFLQIIKKNVKIEPATQIHLFFSYGTFPNVTSNYILFQKTKQTKR